MKSFAVLVALLLTLAGAALPARAANLPEQVHEVLLVVFQSIGADKNGTVQPSDLDGMIRKTFDAMDADQDGSVTPGEFKAFSMGFDYLAQVRGKLAPFNAAKDNVFRRWDANKRGTLSFQDYRAGVLGDFIRELTAALR